MGHILTWAKTQVKRKKNPTLLGSFKGLSKTKVNIKSPQSYNLNPTLTETCVFHRVAGRLGVYLSFTWVFPPQSDYNYGLVSCLRVIFVLMSSLLPATVFTSLLCTELLVYLSQILKYLEMQFSWKCECRVSVKIVVIFLMIKHQKIGIWTTFQVC